MKSFKFQSLEWYICNFKLSIFEALLKKTIRLTKQRHFANLFEQSKSNIKKTWQNINSILNRHKISSTFPEYFSIDGSIVSDPLIIANAFNDFFINTGPRLASSLISPKGTSYENYLIEKPDSSFNFFENVNENTVEQAINSLKMKTSCGHDCITAQMLRTVKSEILSPLTLIINQSFHSGIFPMNLKIAKVIPIYKKDDSSQLTNYRPISLLPCISKIFERIMHTQLLKYFTDNNLFFSNQYGFRPSHSTEHAIVEFVDRLLDGMNSSHIPLSVYIDLSKAFDTLDFDILLGKLSFYGVQNIALNLLSDYLHNRKQYVDFNGNISKSGLIHTGVPQGSILGPLLFLIYINDLSYSSKFFHFISYADDTTLVCNIKFSKNTDINALSSKINEELNNVYDWLLVNKLSLNIGKTKFMLFYKPGKNVPLIRPIIAGNPLEQVSSFNFLGVTIDSSLSWKPHIDKIASKLAKCCGIICRLKNFLPKRILQNIYNALFLSHVNYSILAWGFASTVRLQNLQKKIVRSICRMPYLADHIPLCKSLNFLLIDEIFMSSLLKFYFKQNQNLLPEYYSTFLLETAAHGKNTRFGTQIKLPDRDKDYTRKCPRYGIVELINFTNKPKPSINTNIYKTETKYNKLFIKPPDLILDIINKVSTHSFNGYGKYIKTRFIHG